MTFLSEAWRKARPRAAPMAILSRKSQDKGSMAGFSAQTNNPTINLIYLWHAKSLAFFFSPHLTLFRQFLLLKRWFSKLPFGINSYTRSSSVSSKQYPNNLTRLGCDNLPRKFTSDYIIKKCRLLASLRRANCIHL